MKNISVQYDLNFDPWFRRRLRENMNLHGFHGNPLGVVACSVECLLCLQEIAPRIRHIFYTTPISSVNSPRQLILISHQAKI